MSDNQSNPRRLPRSPCRHTVFAVLAFAISPVAYAGTTPDLLTGGELKALCTINVSTVQICAGYIAGSSDELESTAQGLDAAAAALVAPCPGKQLSELVVLTLKELSTPKALSDPAITAVQLALHLLLGCDPYPSTFEASYFANGVHLMRFCTGNDRNERLQCEGYIRAAADWTLRLLKDPRARSFKACTPTWQTPDQAVSATIDYLKAHPEHVQQVPAPTLIHAALLPSSCPLAPTATSPVRR
jgi:hypothetical protein